MKRSASQNKQIEVLRMALRARKVFGTFEKRAPGEEFDQFLRECLVIKRTLSNPLSLCRKLPKAYDYKKIVDCSRNNHSILQAILIKDR